MIQFKKGNLLEANVDAVVNSVNTVGVMGKGIALMFKERFPDNFKAYEAASKRGDVQIGRMFVTAATELSGPRWIINFPTKKHWRHPSKVEWIAEGLKDLRAVIAEKRIRSVAIPPLGSGNGGLDWSVVRRLIEEAFGQLKNVDLIVYEPTQKYQNVAKGRGVERLTPSRALIAEMIRRYGVLGLECSILEVQKLAWLLVRVIDRQRLKNPLTLKFVAERYGPSAHRLTHLLNALDGSYLHCEKRLADASPSDTIRFDDERRTALAAYFSSSAGGPFLGVVRETDELIDGFQSPLGMEALATVDWLISREGAEPTLVGIRKALKNWPGGPTAAERKQKLFTDKLLDASLERLRRLRGAD
ncbi:MAG: macro domain-containing protein [Tepidisphaeraceae bacterium]